MYGEALSIGGENHNKLSDSAYITHPKLIYGEALSIRGENHNKKHLLPCLSSAETSHLFNYAIILLRTNQNFRGGVAEKEEK